MAEIILIAALLGIIWIVFYQIGKIYIVLKTISELMSIQAENSLSAAMELFKIYFSLEALKKEANKDAGAIKRRQTWSKKREKKQLGKK